MTEIDATIQYLGSDFNSILESVETTLLDIRVSCNGKHIINNDDKSNDIIISNLTARNSNQFFSNSNYKKYFRSALPMNLLSELNNKQFSYDIFKLCYQKSVLLPFNNHIIPHLKILIKETDCIYRKRIYRKLYIWSLAKYERCYYASVYYASKVTNLLLLINNLLSLNHTDFEDAVFNMLALNTRVMDCLKLLNYFFRTFFNEINGSTTSRLNLYTFYYLSGSLQCTLLKHSIIQKSLISYIFSSKMHKSDLGANYTHFFYLIQNNVIIFRHIYSAIIYFGQLNVAILNNMVTNTKTSFNFVTKCTNYLFNDSYHLKCLICANTMKKINLGFMSVIGSADYVPPYFNEILEELIYDFNNVERSGLIGPYYNIVILFTYYQTIRNYTTLVRQIKKSVEEQKGKSELDKYYFRKISEEVRLISNTFKQPRNEINMQRNIIMCFKPLCIRAINNLTKITLRFRHVTSQSIRDFIKFYIELLFKFHLKNFGDLNYIGLYYFGLQKFYIKELSKGKQINSFDALLDDIQAIKLNLKGSKDNLIYFLNDINSQESLALKEKLNKIIPYENIREFAEALVYAKNIVLEPNMRLTFRSDRHF